MTLKSGTGSACAACKFQRRKCTPACVLAPYFPADQPNNFRNAHKLFGVSNIVKLLKMLNDGQKADAMNSIIYQAYIRERYPVHGCLGVILHLNYQIMQKQEELSAVQAQLDMYRQHHHHHLPPADDVPSQLELGMAPPTNPQNGLTLFTSPHNDPNPSPPPPPPHAYNHHHLPNGALPVSHQHSLSTSSNNLRYSSTTYPPDTKDSVGSSSLWAHNQYVAASNNAANSSMVVQPHHHHQLGTASGGQPPVGAVQQQVVHDYDEMLPLFDTIDDRQSYIDSKEAYDSSSEESLKDTTQSVEHVAENELKSAAACFSLTSVN